MADLIQPLRASAFLACDQVHFDRLQNVIGKIRVLSVERLAPNNDELLFASDAASSAQHTVNLLLLHLIF